MKLAFIIDSLHTLKPYKDSSFAMIQAALQRGHTVSVLEVGDLYVRDAGVMARSQALKVDETKSPWWQLGESIETPLNAFDFVLMRKDPPFDIEYVISTYMLELAQRQGARILNDPRAVRDHNEKFAITRFAAFTVPTLVTRDIARIRSFLDEFGEIVVKPLDAMGGSGIFKLRRGDANVNAICEMLSEAGTRTLMAQRFIAEIKDGDKRVLIIDGAVMPYALARVPAADDFRGNLAAGARGYAQPLTPREREIAQALAPALKAEGLFIVGLDIIGGYLTEVNVTSPTGMREIAAQTDCDPAQRVIDALEARLRTV